MRPLPAARSISLAGVLMMAACSSGGTSADDAARASFVVRAEALCTKANIDLKALHAPQAAAEIPSYVHAVATLGAGTARALAGLTLPPKDATALHAKFLDPLLRQSDDGIRFDLQIQKAGTDQAKVTSLLAQAPTATRADLAFLRSYGFHACVAAANTAR
ncbi:MAG: hypothetical protein M3N21_03945 [Actinomycetota bacterium]|nr:hypothetical protein [Actinomycetota bacterium]